MRLPLILDLAADAFGDRVVLVGDNGTLTAEGLRQAARALAGHVLGSGAVHLGFLGENGPGLPVALFGAALAGRPFAPLNYRLTDDALRALALRLAPALVVADDAMAGRLAGLAGVTVLPVSALQGLPAGADLPEGGDDTAVVLFTSGTTGAPKAALLTHANLPA